MRATVSILMLLSLSLTPVTHVLAQVAQRQEIMAQPQPAVPTPIFADTPPVERMIIGVPQRDAHGTATLLLSPAARSYSPVRNTLTPIPTPTPISTAGTLAIAVGVIVVIAAALLVAFVCSGEEWC